MLLIVHNGDGWCILEWDLTEDTKTVISEPYSEHGEAVRAAETMAWRQKQGWPR